MTRVSVILKKAAVAWLVIVPLGMGLSALTYCGPYRWLCEWQSSTGGEQSAFLAGTMPTLLLITPALVYLRLQWDPKSEPPRAPLDPAAVERIARRVLGTVVLGGAAVCAGALFWAEQLPDGSGPAVNVDLAMLGDAAPPAGHVILIGKIDPRHVAQVTMSGKVAVNGEHTLYAPLTSTGTVAGPARIFVAQYVDGATTEPLPSGEGNRFDGVLVQDDLPRGVIRQFAGMGVRVADPHYLLFTEHDGARVNADVVAYLGAFVAVIALLPLLLVMLTGKKRVNGNG